MATITGRIIMIKGEGSEVYVPQYRKWGFIWCDFAVSWYGNEVYSDRRVCSYAQALQELERLAALRGKELKFTGLIDARHW